MRNAFKARGTALRRKGVNDMKTWIRMFATSICGLALVLAASQVSAANLLGNGDFETGALPPWAGVGGLGPNATITVLAGDNGPSAPGTHYAFLDNRAEANGLTMAQTTPNGTAIPGTVYYSFDLKLGTAANGGVFFVEIFAQNAAGAVIGNAGLLGNYAPAGWTSYSGSFVAPAGTDHLTMQFEAPTGAIVGSVSSMSVDNANLHQDPVTPVVGSTWGRMKSLYH
jgi:hypothetical protein